METEKKQTNRWGLAIASLIVFGVVVAILFNPTMLDSLRKKGAGLLKTKGEVVEEEVIERSPRPMPVVEDYFSKGWDFRARNVEEQVIVVTTKEETFESKLFKIGSAVNLCAHLGYAPPLVLVNSERETDSEIPVTYRDIPELIQDIFPKLRVLSLKNPETLVKDRFPGAMVLNGKMRRESSESTDFGEFPKINSTTIIIEGSWESWEYVDDYRIPLFEQLEFHPVIYHHCRKAYPVLFDRRTPVRGIFLDSITAKEVDEIKRFVSRNPIDSERIVIFVKKDEQTEETQRLLEEIFGKNHESKVLVVVGECSHVQIYLGVFCREILVDLTNFGWWVGFHASFRGKIVYRIDNEERNSEVPLLEHYVHPSFRSNKN